MANLFRHMSGRGHEQLIFRHDAPSGLRAVISIHDSSGGRALGGVRFKPYADEEEAVLDALRLSEAMTYKFAVAGLSYGGAKAVIIEHDGIHDREALFRAFGRLVESLNGRFGTGEDVGTTPADMAQIAAETQHVTGLPTSMGGEGDPSPVTAMGVFHAMRAGLEELFGGGSVAGRSVAIQGAGHVGMQLAALLRAEGARLFVADVDPNKARRAADEFGAQTLEPESVYDAECDVFAPCALGGTLDAGNIRRLRCRLVAGGANNQLAGPEHGRLLHERGILYLPDYVVNAGGVLLLTHRLRGVTRDDALRETEAIYATTKEIIAEARRRRAATSDAAQALAESRLALRRSTAGQPTPVAAH